MAKQLFKFTLVASIWTLAALGVCADGRSSAVPSKETSGGVNLPLAMTCLLASSNLLSYLFRKRKDDDEPGPELREEIALGDQKIAELMAQLERLAGVLELLQKHAEAAPDDASLKPGIQAILHEQEIAVQQLEAEQEAQDKRLKAFGDPQGGPRPSEALPGQPEAAQYVPDAKPAKPVSQLDGLQQAIDNTKQKFESMRSQLGAAVDEQLADVDKFAQAYNKGWIDSVAELDKYCDALANLRESIERTWATHEAVALSMKVAGFSPEALEAGTSAIADLKGELQSPVEEPVDAEASADVSPSDEVVAESVNLVETEALEPEASAVQIEESAQAAQAEAELAVEEPTAELTSDEPYANFEQAIKEPVEGEAVQPSAESFEPGAALTAEAPAAIADPLAEDAVQPEAVLETEEPASELQAEEGVQPEAILESEQASSDLQPEGAFDANAELQPEEPVAIAESEYSEPAEPEAVFETEDASNSKESPVEDPSQPEAILQDGEPSEIVDQLAGEPVGPEAELEIEEPTAISGAIDEPAQPEATQEFELTADPEGALEPEASFEGDEPVAIAAFADEAAQPEASLEFEPEAGTEFEPVSELVEPEAEYQEEYPAAIAEGQDGEISQPEAILEQEPEASAEFDKAAEPVEAEAFLQSDESVPGPEALQNEPVELEAALTEDQPESIAERVAEEPLGTEAYLQSEEPVESLGEIEVSGEPEASLESESSSAVAEVAEEPAEPEAIGFIVDEQATLEAPEDEPTALAEAPQANEEPEFEDGAAAAFLPEVQPAISEDTPRETLEAEGFQPFDEIDADLGAASSVAFGSQESDGQALDEATSAYAEPAPNAAEAYGAPEAALEDGEAPAANPEAESGVPDEARDAILQEFDIWEATEPLVEPVTEEIVYEAIEAESTEPAAFEPEASIEPETSIEPVAGIEPEASFEAEASFDPEASIEPEASVQPEGSIESEASVEPAAELAEPEAAPEQDSAPAPDGAMQQAFDRGDVILVDPKSEDYTLIKKAAVGGRSSLTDPTVSIERAVERMRELYDVTDSTFRAALERGVERIADPSSSDPSAPAAYMPVADDETRSLVRTLIGRAEPGDLDVVRRMISRGSRI